MADKKGNPKAVPKAELWFGDPVRREFINGLTFQPDQGKEIEGSFNIWEGWRYEEKKGDWSLFKTHIRNMVGSEEEYTVATRLDGRRSARTDEPKRLCGCDEGY